MNCRPKIYESFPNPIGLNFKHNKWSDAWLQSIKPYKAASWRRLLKYRFDCTLQLPMHKVRMLLFVSFLKTKVKGIKCVHKMASRRRLQMTDEKHLSFASVILETLYWRGFWTEKWYMRDTFAFNSCCKIAAWNSINLVFKIIWMRWLYNTYKFGKARRM